MNKKDFEAIRGSLIAFSKNNDKKTYREIVKTLYEQEKWNYKFSEKYLQSRISEIAVKIQESTPNKAGSYLKDLTNHFETYNQIHQVYIPVDNLVVGKRRLKIGKVTFVSMTPRIQKSVVSQFQ